jgi:hypothetical protein
MSLARVDVQFLYGIHAVNLLSASRASLHSQEVQLDSFLELQFCLQVVAQLP